MSTPSSSQILRQCTFIFSGCCGVLQTHNSFVLDLRLTRIPSICLSRSRIACKHCTLSTGHSLHQTQHASPKANLTNTKVAGKQSFRSPASLPPDLRHHTLRRQQRQVAQALCHCVAAFLLTFAVLQQHSQRLRGRNMSEKASHPQPSKFRRLMSAKVTLLPHSQAYHCRG